MSRQITDTDLKLLISKKLQQLRQNSQQTLEETAYFLDLDYAQYYRILKGDRLPHLSTLLKINQIYGLYMNWWFSELKSPDAKLTKKSDETELLCNFNKINGKTKKVVLKILRNLAQEQKSQLLFMAS